MLWFHWFHYKPQIGVMIIQTRDEISYLMSNIRTMSDKSLDVQDILEERIIGTTDDDHDAEQHLLNHFLDQGQSTFMWTQD